MTGLGITRQPDESALDCALRYARPWGLEVEVREAYDEAIARGDDEDAAALHACMEWDVAALVVDGKEREVRVETVEFLESEAF